MQRVQSSHAGQAQLQPAQPLSQAAWTAACQASSRAASASAAALVARHVCAAAHQAGCTPGTARGEPTHAASLLPSSQASAPTALSRHTTGLANRIISPLHRRSCLSARISGQLPSRTQPLHAVAPALSWFGKVKASVEELVGIAPPVADPTLPTHWEQQLVKLTVGKRRALERWVTVHQLLIPASCQYDSWNHTTLFLPCEETSTRVHTSQHCTRHVFLVRATRQDSFQRSRESTSIWISLCAQQHALPPASSRHRSIAVACVRSEVISLVCWCLRYKRTQLIFRRRGRLSRLQFSRGGFLSQTYLSIWYKHVLPRKIGRQPRWSLGSGGHPLLCDLLAFVVSTQKSKH